MPWFWTDDLANLLIEACLVDESEVREWMTRPNAVAAPEDANPLEVARSLAGVSTDESEVAGAA